ncbi:hypothetical protein [Hydrogenophaga sp.]|uniref:hypothetical protein n=1 Tax=Hydrogenophaga sp. TaxID=1904254 RepID=UPI003F6BF5C6
MKGLKAGDALAWVLAGSLLGMLALGAVVSVIDVPLVALILLLFVFKNNLKRG